MVPEMKNYDYANRLKKLALPSLPYRRKRGVMIEVYKYTHGLYNDSALPVEMGENTTRGHNYKLKKKDVPPHEDRHSSLCESSMPGID